MNGERGLTLIEMLIVVAIIAVLIGVAFPSVTAGLETIRLRSASDEMVAAFNAALNRAERRQFAVEVIIDRQANRVRFASADNTYRRELSLPQGVTIERIFPAIANVDDTAPRQFLIHPGGTVPRIGVEIRNARNTRRLVMVDPISGVPQIVENPQ